MEVTVGIREKDRGKLSIARSQSHSNLVSHSGINTTISDVINPRMILRESIS